MHHLRSPLESRLRRRPGQVSKILEYEFDFYIDMFLVVLASHREVPHLEQQVRSMSNYLLCRPMDAHCAELSAHRTNRRYCRAIAFYIISPSHRIYIESTCNDGGSFYGSMRVCALSENEFRLGRAS